MSGVDDEVTQYLVGTANCCPAWWEESVSVVKTSVHAVFFSKSGTYDIIRLYNTVK